MEAGGGQRPENVEVPKVGGGSLILKAKEKFTLTTTVGQNMLHCPKDNSNKAMVA